MLCLKIQSRSDLWFGPFLMVTRRVVFKPIRKLLTMIRRPSFNHFEVQMNGTLSQYLYFEHSANIISIKVKYWSIYKSKQMRLTIKCGYHQIHNTNFWHKMTFFSFQVYRIRMSSQCLPYQIDPVILSLQVWRQRSTDRLILNSPRIFILVRSVVLKILYPSWSDQLDPNFSKSSWSWSRISHLSLVSPRSADNCVGPQLCWTQRFFGASTNFHF